MTPLHKLKVVEQCRVIPAAGGSQTCLLSLPLTYFDLLFLHFPPVQRLFFYDLPLTKSHLLDTELTKLKLSLSLALCRFYPLAGNLTFSAGSGHPPAILCSDTDYVSFTTAISTDDFYDLSANHARASARFRSLLPPLPSEALLSVQVTLFPNAGISIGTTLHHAAADGSSYTHFMKTWAGIARLGEKAALSILPPPIFDRAVVTDNRGLGKTFLKDLEDLKDDKSMEAWDLVARSNLVRASLVVGPEEIRRLSRRTSAKCSAYALVCGLAWSSLARARGDSRGKKEKFGFVTGCRPRLKPAVAAEYFGNCLGICCVEIGREELVGEKGAAAAAEAIWEVIRGLEKGAFEGAEGWMRAVRKYAAAGALTVAGSPKLGIYGVDYGWGRPRKVEVVSVERTGALSLAESGDLEGGIEVGIALPKQEMDKFVEGFFAELAMIE